MSEQRSSLSFERIADRYDATRGGEQRGRRTAASLAPLLDPVWPVVEIGIGTGVIALGLRELGFAVVGVDLSPAMTQRARRRLGPVVAVADAAHLPVADAAIEQAVSIWLLHLVADRAAVMAEVARALRPGGRYLVSSARVGVPPTDDIDRLVFDMRNQLTPDGTTIGAHSLARRATPSSDPTAAVTLSPRATRQAAMPTRLRSRQRNRLRPPFGRPPRRAAYDAPAP